MIGILYTDGGSRGNPGKAAGGVVVYDKNDKVISFDAKYFGIKTNNQSEYQALILGISLAKKLGIKELQVKMDSELIVKQMLGEYKVENPEIIVQKKQVDSLLVDFNKVTFQHISREENTFADKLVNIVLDTKQ